MFQKMTQFATPYDWDVCGSDMVFRPQMAAEQAFGVDTGFTLPLSSQNTTGAQFAYLFRRFGYPISGWDDYKELVSYFLTTPEPDVILWCKPSSHLRYSFGYGKSLELSDKTMRLEMEFRGVEWKAHPIRKRIESAITAAMTELLRPVFVRDVPYNIVGRVPDESPYVTWERAKYSPQAGFGIGEFDPTLA